ncbi:MAG: type IV pilus biogenesis/stability protein PilW [Halothiobacillaceae bacterium]
MVADGRRMVFALSMCAGLLVLGGCSTTGPGSVTDESLGEDTPHLGVSENREAARINTELGVGYLERGYLELAVEKLERAVRFDGRYAPAHHALALAMEQVDETDRARQHFERAVALAPDDPQLQNNYGAFLCGEGAFDEAQAAFKAALSRPLYRTPEFALTNAGMCYQDAGDHEAAVNAFRRALERRPGYAPAQLDLARSLLEAGQPAEAAEAMRTFENAQRHTPASLKLAIRIDEAVGDRDARASHALLLRGRFPDSDEARWLEQRQTP